MQRIRIYFAALALSMIAMLAAKLGSAQQPPVYDPPRVISSMQADYPVNSIAAGGAVILEAQLDETGALKDIRVLQDVPSLTEPAKAALKKWKFEPARWNGKAVESKLPVVFSFNIPYWCGPGPRKKQ
ncbi:MAG TPA: energy transducer TonB [Candidatus Nitrosotenuis sp.]|nr:energy transducer TonB [Candidatus Nitrosotenuis sp.]